MRLKESAFVALGVGICDAERLAAGLRDEVQRFHNISSSTRFSQTLHRPAVTSPHHTTITAPGNSNASSPYLNNNTFCDPVPTINAPTASLDWWYPFTAFDAISTFSSKYNSNHSSTGWTLLPSKTAFNLDSALDLTTPIGAQTTAITQIAHKTLNATTGTGQIPNAIINPPPPSITLPNHGSTFSEGTPFVHFSKYEVISKSLTSYKDGRVGCVTVTKTSPMVTPFAIPYTGAQNGSESFTTGNIDRQFLALVNETSAVLGSWVAAPTVIFVVQKVFAAEVAFAAASIERTEATLMLPTPTLPSFLSSVKPKTTEEHLPTGNPHGQTETTETFLLVPTPASTTKKGGGKGGNSKTTHAVPVGGGQMTMVPFVAHIEHSDITLIVPANPTQTLLTTKLANGKITATRIRPQPTNAIQVLSEALESDKNPKPTTAPNQAVHVIVVGTTTLTAYSNTQFHLPGSKTLTPGGTAVLAGTRLSLLPDGSSIVINGHTKAVSSVTVTPAPALTINGHVFHANSGSAYIIDGKTLTPGGAISVSGTRISLAQDLSSIVVNGVTKHIAPASVPSPPITSAPALTIGGQKFTPISDGATYDINGHTLTPGERETVMIHGKKYIVSLAPGATILEIEKVGAGGVVTATLRETLYPGGRWKDISVTTTIGTARPKSSESGPHRTTRPAANLQNAAPLPKIQLSLFFVALASHLGASAVGLVQALLNATF